MQGAKCHKLPLTLMVHVVLKTYNTAEVEVIHSLAEWGLLIVNAGQELCYCCVSLLYFSEISCVERSEYHNQDPL